MKAEWVLAVAAVLLAASPLTGRAAGGDITALKRLYPTTPLVVVGNPVAAIVVPDDPRLQNMARQLADEIRRRSGASPEILAADKLVSRWWEIDFTAIQGRSLIALGNINTNRLLGALWGAGYTDEDSTYPGDGGYVVRTVHDPFAKGFNVVVLAGSDTDGVRRAVDAFCRKHLPGPARDLVLRAPITDIQLGKEPSPYVGQASGRLPHTYHHRWPSAFEIEQGLSSILSSDPIPYTDPNDRAKGTLVNVTGALATIAEAYFHTGDPGLPPLMKQVVDRNRALLQVVPGRVEMEAASSEHMVWWDIVEELPIWTDRDRLDVTNAFLQDARQGFERGEAHDLVKKGYVQVVAENHATNSALNTFRVWSYFEKYYHLPDTAYWMSVVHATFAGSLASHQMLEDSAGYNVYAPEDAVVYALASQDTRYFRLGIAADHLAYYLQTSYNNLALSTGFGDAGITPVYPWEARLLYTMGWYLGDPRVMWWLRSYVPNECGQDTYQDKAHGRVPLNLGIPLREPTEWTGMQVFPIWKQTLGWERASKQVVTSPREPVGPEWFTKVVFREAWSPNAQYLLLDGAGTWDRHEGYPPGPEGHMHSDINTIINFTDKGRVWLVDNTYSARSITDHSGLTITRGGSFSHDDRPARLKDAAEGAGFALTRSVVDDYCGADWERTIFWYQGHHFLVLDRAIAKQPGEYAVRCNYRTLGKPTVGGQTLDLEQQGKRCRITSDGGAALELQPIVPAEVKDWETLYPYADPVIGMLQEYKSAALQPGQALSFVNLIQAGENGAKLDTLSLVSDSAALVTGSSGIVSYGLGNPPGGIAAARVYLIGGKAALFAGLTRLGKDEAPLLTSSAPINLWISPTEGAGIEASAPVSITLAGGKVMQLAHGKHALKLDPAAQLLSISLAAARQQSVSRLEPQSLSRGVSATRALETKRVSLGAEANRMVSADLNGDGGKEWIIAGQDGARAYTQEGKLIWRFATDKPCRAIAAADVDGDSKVEVALGCDDEKLYLLDSVGLLRWSFQCKSTSYSPPPAVRDVQISDVDGDGKLEILVIASWVHCLDAIGNVKWENYWRYGRGVYWGAARQIAVDDYDGDGKPEVVVAYYDSYPAVTSYDGAGKAKPLVAYIGTPQSLLLMDLAGERKGRQIMMGSDEQLEALRPDKADSESSKQVKREPLDQGSFTYLASYQPEGGQPILYAATDMGTLIAYCGGRAANQSGTIGRLWTRVTGEQLTQLAAVESGQVLAGTKTGAVIMLDGEGGGPLAHTAPTGSPVVQLMPDGNTTLIVHADGVVEIMAAQLGRTES